MIKKGVSWLAHKLLQLFGWKLVGSLPAHVPQAVMVVAPHTSNWDAFYGLLALLAQQLPVKFAIKKEALFFPLGSILKRLGAVPIDRTKQSSLKMQASKTVDQLADLFRQHERLFFVIAPEGTRKRVKRWRTGFHHIAKKAQVPILLAYLDYAKKEAGVGPLCYPTEDQQGDIARFQAFYKDKRGKHPAQGVY